MQDYIPIEIDINDKIGVVTVKQFDNMSRFLHLQITDKDLMDGEGAALNIVDCEARLYVQPAEGKPQYIDGEIADGENGIVTFTLQNSITSKAGSYNCEIWITQPEEKSVISTKPFLLHVERSIRNDDALEAGESFSALENALIRVAVDRARLNNLEAMTNSANVVPGTVDSEVLDIRTAYDGTTYSTAGNAVREQINQIRNSVAEMKEFLYVTGGGYEENEAAQRLVSDLKSVLKQAKTFQTQIDCLGGEFEKVVEFIPGGGITDVKLCDGCVSAEKLSPALKRPSIVVSSGTVTEMLRVAETYFNYAYTNDGEESGLLYESHTGLYSDSLGSNGENGQYGIVCSSFAEAVINGISFENSRYSGNVGNAKFNWGVEFDDAAPFGSTENPTSVEIRNKYLTSQALAMYAAKHGYLYEIDGSQNVRAGDLLFSGNVPGRYLGIDHVAIVINADNMYCTVLEAWRAKKTDISGAKHDVGLRIKYRASISDYTYGAVFPIGDVVNIPEAVESVCDISGKTAEKATLIHEFKTHVNKGFYTVVCHGEFSSMPYVSLKYDGAESNTYQSLMHGTGSDYYLTVYVEKSAIVSLRMEKDATYDINEAALYSGYADISVRTSNAIILNSGDDLDECLDGLWYCQNTETAKNIIHAPLSESKGGFRLEAVKMNNKDRYMQTLWYVGVPDKMYVRMYVSTGWTGWFVYSGTAV